MASAALAKKTVLITGGAQGLGKAIADACLSAGANVTVFDINDKLLHECETELSKKGPLLALKVDVSSEESATKAFEAVVQKFQRLDVLVNCAGILDGFHPVDTLDFALWSKVIAVNLTGPYLISKLAVRQFLAQSPSTGSIVNVGSGASLRGAAAGAAYTASKHGLIGLTKHTAASYSKQGIRCNAVLPGGMVTNLVLPYLADTGSRPDFSESGWANISKITAMGVPFVDVNDVSKTIVHLASDVSRGASGSVVAIDNGWGAF